MIELRFTISWPPSVNSYFSVMHKGPLAGRIFVSTHAKHYRERVAKELMAQRVPLDRLTGSIELVLVAHPPDRRARDLDNILKPILDSLKQARVIDDDRFIDRLTIGRGACEERFGRIECTLRQLAIHSAPQLELR